MESTSSLNLSNASLETIYEIEAQKKKSSSTFKKIVTYPIVGMKNIARIVKNKTEKKSLEATLNLINRQLKKLEKELSPEDKIEVARLLADLKINDGN
jgi:hypothetical protein